MNELYHIERVSDDDKTIIQDLADLTIDSVRNGASIGFMRNVTQTDARQFWNQVLDKASQGKVVLLLARESNTHQVVGTLQLHVDLPNNQIHRADVAKMMVHAEHRRKGIAEQLLMDLEKIALLHNKHVLVLDTVTGGPAQRLYLKCG